jgi:hypothetical protein
MWSPGKLGYGAVIVGPTVHRIKRTDESLLLTANVLQFADLQRKPVSPGRDSTDREFRYVSGSPRGISWSFPIPIDLIRGVFFEWELEELEASTRPPANLSCTGRVSRAKAVFVSEAC